jgi:hypothetical protein
MKVLYFRTSHGCEYLDLALPRPDIEHVGLVEAGCGGDMGGYRASRKAMTARTRWRVSRAEGTPSLLKMWGRFPPALRAAAADSVRQAFITGLHAGSLAAAHWRHVVPLLTPHYAVVAADNRGFGGSQRPSSQATSASSLAADPGPGRADMSSPCLMRFVSGSGQVRYRLGERLVDWYLEFVAGRCRPNTLRTVAFDVKTFFGSGVCASGKCAARSGKA